jgi:hypothetical protein
MKKWRVILTPSIEHVAHVISLRANQKVVRVYAATVIAFVPHNQAFDFGHFQVVGKAIGNPVGKNGLAFFAQYTIATPIEATSMFYAGGHGGHPFMWPVKLPANPCSKSTQWLSPH